MSCEATTSNINVIHQDNPDTDLTNPVPKIWLPLPYLGKYGTRLIRSFIHRITPLLKLKFNFIINWKTTNSNSFLSSKDKTPAKYQSSVVYEFTCPGCKRRYIGKQIAASTPESKNTHWTTNLKSLTTSHHANTFNISNPF